ncbi:tripartite tricarboxylate transporter substrate binding protein [Cupriavidus sp. D384]|uniref:Bug family tripartite tricarboxylate transporter substrate binding protein n=1 Tax=Cupriavidus sp. D384 TaxID=1538095 RepID=UPI000835CD39|nr:tripartite tricarboxylate transporter substrate binding protein [Cupriavidus sp. D384]
MNQPRTLGATRRNVMVAMMLSIPIAVSAQSDTGFPSRSLTMVVPFTAAGPTDSLARVIAAAMKKPLNQSVVVDNRAGAGGNIGAQYVARSKPDGYTILFGSSGPLLINTSLYKNAGFDPIRDFTPIQYVGEIPNVLVVNPALPVHSLKELVTYCQQREGLTYASSGNGQTNHMAGEMFNKKIGARLTHVPYKGTAPALNDLLGNQVTMMYVDVLSAAPHIKAGKLRALGVASLGRSRILPEVPTFREQGVPTLEQGVAFGIVAPAGLPKDVLSKLATATREAIQSAEVQENFARLGVETTTSGQQTDFGSYMRSEVGVWRQIVMTTGARID